MRTFTTELPTYYGTNCLPGFVKIKAEEEAIIWLWANPSILHWKKPLAWLFSPVTGKAKWPGDLWGIDSHGDLIVLENKRGNRKNPFEDFVPYAKKRHDEITAKHLKAKWEKQYKSETRRSGCLDPRKHKQGIVPRSSHAAPLVRWGHLAQVIDKQVLGHDYPRNVRSWLSKREKRGSPIPHYVGLVVSNEKESPKLSDSGLKSMRTLQKLVGRKRVHLFVARCEKTPGPAANVEICLSRFK